jgi:hypothetical protein
VAGLVIAGIRNPAPKLTSRVLVAGVSVRLPSGFLLLQLHRETFVAVRGDCIEHTGERLTVSIVRHPALTEATQSMPRTGEPS